MSNTFAQSLSRCKSLVGQMRACAQSWRGVGVDPALRSRVSQALADVRKKGPIAGNLQFLVDLHAIFPKQRAGLEYDRDALLNRARTRFGRWREAGIPLSNIDMLDLAAGHGENLLAAHEFGLRSAVAIDYSAEKFHSLANTVPAEISEHLQYIEANLDTLRLEKDSYDLVVSDNAFQFFARPEQLFEECHHALRRGGWCVFEFGPLFHSPWGGHRYTLTGVPYLQNIFSDEIAYEFFYDTIRIGPQVHRYSGEHLARKDPYAELNRWPERRFTQLFCQDPRWRVVGFERGYDFSQMWVARLFKPEMSHLGWRDRLVTRLRVVLQKR